LTTGLSRPRRRLLAAFAALVVVWVAAPGAVPLYDGINFPDEPYRYVVPPAGYQATPKPTSGRGDTQVAEGTNVDTVYVNTDEQAPQINVVIPNRLLKVSASVRTLAVTAVPRAPDRQPSKGKIDGNVYRVTASGAPAGTAVFDPPPGDAASASLVILRATSAKRPAPVFLFRGQPGLAWRVLPTAPYGNDIYRTQFAGFGDYALAFGVVTTTTRGSSAVAIIVSVLLVVILLAGAAVLVVRVRRRRA